METLRGFEFQTVRTIAGVAPGKAAEMFCLSLKQLRKIEREDLQIPEFDRLNQSLEKLVFSAFDRLLVTRQQWKGNNY